MKRKLILILLIPILISCNNEKHITQYYPSRNIKLKVQIDKDSIQNGTYQEFYENGELKSKTNYVNGEISDSLFNYYESGKIKEKGTVKNNFQNGWWQYYSANGQLKEKIEWIIIKDSLHKNQTILYDQNGEINYENSSFFILRIPDTIHIGKNRAYLDYYSNFKVYKKLFGVVIENEYSENVKKLDSFYVDSNDFLFGIYAYKEGPLKVKGHIIEELYDVREIGNDSAIGTVSNHKKFFEKEVYVTDKNN